MSRLLALGFVLGVLPAFAAGECPQVYRIHGSAPVEKALNVVVIGDAFTADNIDDFRCAAGLTMEKLVATPPFNRYSDSINIYRVDLVSTRNGVVPSPTTP